MAQRFLTRTVFAGGKPRGLSVVCISNEGAAYCVESFQFETESTLYVDAPLAILPDKLFIEILNSKRTYSEIVEELALSAVPEGKVLIKIELGNCIEMFTDLAK